ncbi:hypothetical protein ACIBUY_03840 [Streptomyces sp. NPDC050085]|uniref:hypothetical protein n=1 Tax=Streptomyces sp. NPDC050085 TaxID=3365600 RepID=UPI0037A960F1
MQVRDRLAPSKLRQLLGVFDCLVKEGFCLRDTALCSDDLGEPGAGFERSCAISAPIGDPRFDDAPQMRLGVRVPA